MVRSKAVAILDTMWDWDARTSKAGYKETAPPYFRINGNNHSGQRLYKLLGHTDLLVTNICKELADRASGLGKPDYHWLAVNLFAMKFELLLVCGNRAKNTFEQAVRKTQLRQHIKNSRVIMMPHPAARIWTNAALLAAAEAIQYGSGNFSIRLPRSGGTIIEGSTYGQE